MYFFLINVETIDTIINIDRKIKKNCFLRILYTMYYSNILYWFRRKKKKKRKMNKEFEELLFWNKRLRMINFNVQTKLQRCYIYFNYLNYWIKYLNRIHYIKFKKKKNFSAIQFAFYNFMASVNKIHTICKTKWKYFSACWQSGRSSMFSMF